MVDVWLGYDARKSPMCKEDLKYECVYYLQGSELAGWAEGRYSFEGIDLNHNFPDLNNIMWDRQETAEAMGEREKAPNHYIPIPEYYTQEDAMVRRVDLPYPLGNPE